jgi:hypothetical protein
MAEVSVSELSELCRGGDVDEVHCGSAQRMKINSRVNELKTYLGQSHESHRLVPVRLSNYPLGT